MDREKVSTSGSITSEQKLVIIEDIKESGVRIEEISETIDRITDEKAFRDNFFGITRQVEWIETLILAWALSGNPQYPLHIGLFDLETIII